jgi:hypothetical protein
MTDSTGELMKSYEVITSIVARHSQYDAAMILTLNLASCITVGFPRWYRRRQRPTALLFRLTYHLDLRVWERCALPDALLRLLQPSASPHLSSPSG